MKNISKKLLFSLLFIMSIILLAGCGATPAEEPTKQSADDKQSSEAAQDDKVYTVLTPKNAPAFAAVMMEKYKLQGLNVKVETWTSIEELLPRLQKKEVDFAAVPLNVGAKLAKKQLPLQLIHVNTWGTIYMVSTDPAIKSLKDLEGETLYIAHQSGSPDILTKYFLEKEGLTGKVTISYTTPPELTKLLMVGKAKHAVLPEPFLSVVRGKLGDGLHEVINYGTEWQGVSGNELPQAGFVVNAEWAKQNPEVVAKFNKAYEEAIKLVAEKPDEAAQLAAEKLGMDAASIKNSFAKIKLELVPASEARPVVDDYLDKLNKLQPESVGGTLPADSFYYVEQK